MSLALLLLACRPDPEPGPGPDPVADWIAAMTLEEKVAELHGAGALPEGGLWRSGGNARLGIPEFAMSDGPRGVTAGTSTTFPVGMARGATFDPELERRVAEAIASELLAKGGNVILAPVVETLRHPAWGRAQETYGEDPHHLARMGVAFVEGAQAVGAVATPKHFAVNSIEDTRFDVDVTIDDRALRELYLPPHHAVVAAGAGAIMSAYNSVNGSYCAENRVLLTDVLRDDWGFDGLVMSDWLWGTHDTLGMADAGLNVEMPAPQFYGEDLVAAVGAGQVTEARIDELLRPVLDVKHRFGLADLSRPDAAVIESPAHTALALEVALGSMVLLEDDGALPLADAATVLVVGDMATWANLGDEGSSNAHPSYAVSPLVGIEEAAAAHGATVTWSADATGAEAADAVVVVVGLTSEDEGEKIPLFPGGDREDLGLHPEDEALIADAVARNPRTVVVIEAGSAIRVDPWVDDVAGLVLAFYPGMEGGTALGQLLFGDVPFSGRLPFAVPVADADLPAFDHVSHEVTYDRWHGYRHLDRQGTAPRYPFGFGLSGTTFTYAGLAVGAPSGGAIPVSVDVTNTGSTRGAEVVQVYFGSADVPDGAVRELRAFEKIWLDPGERRTVNLSVPLDDLRYWDGGWRSPAATWTVEVGSNHRDLPLSATVVTAP